MSMFPDIADLSAESRTAIEYLVRGELIRGRQDGRFDPKASITREEAAIIAWRQLNWPALASDEFADATAFLMLFGSGNAVGGGSSWWRAPRALYTNKHVGVETWTDDNGKVRYTPYDALAKANGGWVRNDRSPTGQPQLGIVWDEKDPRDICARIVPVTLWEMYLNAREAAGLRREPLYIDPHSGREPIQGEPVANMGSPLMDDFTLNAGHVAKVQIMRTEGDQAIEYVSVTAGINPGNSGGLCLTLDRRFVGMPTLKPYSHTAFGWTAADDLGYVLHWREILKWEAKMKWMFDALGIEL